MTCGPPARWISRPGNPLAMNALAEVEAEAPNAEREVQNTGSPVQAMKNEAQQYRS